MDTSKIKLSTIIAIVILSTFCVLMVTAFVFMWSEPAHEGVFSSVSKEGFLLLGGIVSTVIGYYFGNRTGEAIAESARRDLKDWMEKVPSNK